MIWLAVVLLIMGGCGIVQERVLLEEDFIIEIEEVYWGLYRAKGTASDELSYRRAVMITPERQHAVLAMAREYCAQRNKYLRVGTKTLTKLLLGDSYYEIHFQCEYPVQAVPERSTHERSSQRYEDPVIAEETNDLCMIDGDGRVYKLKSKKDVVHLKSKKDVVTCREYNEMLREPIHLFSRADDPNARP